MRAKRRRTAADGHGARYAPTIVRQRAVPDAQQAFAEALRASGSQLVVDETAIVLPDEQRVRQKLALLLEVSKALTRAPDVATLLEKIAEMVFQILDVDRFAILLLDEHQRSHPQHRARSRRREPRPDSAAVHRAQGDRGEGRDSVGQCAGGRALQRPVDCASAGALGRLRATDRDGKPGRRRACTWTA